MQQTVPHPYLGREFIGYVVNSEISPKNQKIIAKLQKKLRDRFNDAIYIPKPGTLHITLMDWVAPLVDYGKDKDILFGQIHEKYNEALKESVLGTSPIKVRFGSIHVSPEAIFLIGTDDGQYRTIRQNFLKKIELLPNTKKPPQIIHTTIARFTKEFDLQTIRDFAKDQTIAFEQTVDRFRLLRSTDTSMEGKKIIKYYNLR